MQLVFLILAVAAGGALCDSEVGDLDCFAAQLTLCGAPILAKIKAQGASFKACSAVPNATKCLRDSSDACKMKLGLDDLTTLLRDACDESSDLYKKVAENEVCMTKEANSLKSCVKIKIDPTDVTPEKILEMEKEQCRQLDSVVPCVKKQFEEKCGKGAGEVSETIIKPLLELMKPLCAEILKGAAPSLVVSSYSVLFALALALFVWTKQ